jgi:hypothetical protein
MKQSLSWETNSRSSLEFPVFYGIQRFIAVFTRARINPETLCNNSLEAACVCVCFIFYFYGEGMLSPRPTRLEDHASSAVR